MIRPERSTLPILRESLGEPPTPENLGELLGEMAILVGCHKTYHVRYLQRRIDELKEQRGVRS